MFYGYVLEGAFLGLTVEGVIKGTGVVYNGLPEVTSFYDVTGARIGATKTIPCTELTIAQLNADFNKYLNMQVKLTDVEVSDAFSNSDKNGKVKQGTDELALYVKATEAFEAAQGSKADLVVFPAVFNANKQAYVWAADDYKPTVVGGQITMVSKFTVNVGETVKLGATTNSTATIKYSSADEAIATVSAEGVVTGVKEGTVEITASVEAVDGFSAAEAKTTITVKPAGTISEDKYFVKVTEAPTDWSGTYLIVWDSEAHSSVSKKDLVKTCDLTLDGNRVVATDEVKAASVVIASFESGYSIQLSDSKYLTVPASNACGSNAKAMALSIILTKDGAEISGKDSNDATRYLCKNGEFYRMYKSVGSYVLPTLFKLED